MDNCTSTTFVAPSQLMSPNEGIKTVAKAGEILKNRIRWRASPPVQRLHSRPFEPPSGAISMVGECRSPNKGRLGTEPEEAFALLQGMPRCLWFI